MSPHTPGALRLRRRLLALTLTACTLFPVRGEAGVQPSAGAYISWIFGAEGGIGWGVELSAMALLQGDTQCQNWGKMPIGVGPTVQLGFRGAEAPRLVVAAAGGLNPMHLGGPLTGLQAEAGVAFPLGPIGAFGPHGGLVASGLLAHAFGRLDPGMGEGFALGIGPRLPATFNLQSTCAAGRPTRAADGAAVTGGTGGAGGNTEADAWLDDARAECDSVPAFLGLAAELLALGAPASLVEAALRAAEEEMSHARSAALLARRFGARVRGPSLPLPPDRRCLNRGAALARLAVEGFVDGVIGEGAAAAEAAAAARCSTDLQIAGHYHRVAVEEGRHAALGRRVAIWALRAGGQPVREALSAVRTVERGAPPESGDLATRLRPGERTAIGEICAVAARRDLMGILLA